MMPEPEESVYLSVATLWSLCILIFLAELNGLLMMQVDIGNAYLESYTQGKVYFIAGPDFSQYGAQSCIIEKALYGVKSSGLHFHEKLSKVLCKFGFELSRVDLDMWMHDSNNKWEYIVVHVDDIIVAMKNHRNSSMTFKVLMLVLL